MSEGDKNELSEVRTDLSEDRTVLANERTFGSWLRTGFGAAAIGLGFHALFGKMEPWWAPRLIASLFLLLAILIFYLAERRSCAVIHRLSAHVVKPFSHAHIRILAILASVGTLTLLVAIWLLPVSSA